MLTIIKTVWVSTAKTRTLKRCTLTLKVGHKYYSAAIAAHHVSKFCAQLLTPKYVNIGLNLKNLNTKSLYIYTNKLIMILNSVQPWVENTVGLKILFLYLGYLWHHQMQISNCFNHAGLKKGRYFDTFENLIWRSALSLNVAWSSYICNTTKPHHRDTVCEEHLYEDLPEQSPAMISSPFGSWYEMWSCTHGPVKHR